MDTYLQVIIHTVTAIVFLFLMTRLMGKKQISQMTFFDYAAGIAIGSVSANFSVTTDLSFAEGLSSILLWAMLPIAVSYLTLRKSKARKILAGVPTILVQNGLLISANLKKAKLSVDDVLEQLRLKNAYYLSDVDMAVLEISGKVSVLLKPGKQPADMEAVNDSPAYRGLAANLIVNGTLMRENLKTMGQSEQWLRDEMEKQGFASYENILLGCVDAQNTLYISPLHPPFTPRAVL